jgi:hypothetical protein
MIDRAKIRKELPHGKLSEIAKEAKVAQPSVSNWFSGKINSERIEVAVVRVYVKYKKERNKLEQELLAVDNI